MPTIEINTERLTLHYDLDQPLFSSTSGLALYPHIVEFRERGVDLWHVHYCGDHLLFAGEAAADRWLMENLAKERAGTEYAERRNFTEQPAYFEGGRHYKWQLGYEHDGIFYPCSQFSATIYPDTPANELKSHYRYTEPDVVARLRHQYFVQGLR